MSSITRLEERFFAGRRARLAFRVGAVLVPVLIVVRVLLPWAVVRIANERLANLPGYEGSVGAADLRVLRGGFALEDVVFRKTGETDGALLIEAEKVGVSFSWIRLAGGRVEAEIVVTRPTVFFSAGRNRAEPTEAGQDPREVLAGLARFEITRLEIVHGAAELEWPVGERTQTLAITETRARFAHLSNAPVTRASRRATAEIEARLSGAIFTAEAEGAPLANPPLVEARARLDALELTVLNPLLIEALGTDVTEGTLEVEAAFRAAEGYYEGFVKPFVRDARFTRPGSDDVSFAHGVREAVLDVAAKVLRNDDSERVATKVTFSGRFGDGEVDAWGAFTALLGNAFGEALRAGMATGE